MVISKKNKDINQVLMDPQAKPAIKKPYSIIVDKDQAIFVLPPGLNGVEYNKTEGYVSNYSGVQVYQCLYGQGILLMQRIDESGEAKEFKVVTLNEGRQVGIPAGWAMCLVNIGKTYLVVVGNISIDSKNIDFEPVVKKGGLAYFVVEKKGEISSTDVVSEIQKHKGKAYYAATFEDAAKLLKGKLTEDTLLLTIGAGDVWKLHKLIK